MKILLVDAYDTRLTSETLEICEGIIEDRKSVV